ncbi:hypothetical protein E2C01_092816 [Portunus trituberculatus]|uniref:Uncharacterized protein n=1 Tax=Portunus trituberculatus TaxID=210409 RepID=A0A5B7JWX3_PORTR|nr:hypothetical protein [Portunus trituberculatus]
MKADRHGAVPDRSSQLTAMTPSQTGINYLAYYHMTPSLTEADTAVDRHSTVPEWSSANSNQPPTS